METLLVTVNSSDGTSLRLTLPVSCTVFARPFNSSDDGGYYMIQDQQYVQLGDKWYRVDATRELTISVESETLDALGIRVMSRYEGKLLGFLKREAEEVALTELASCGDYILETARCVSIVSFPVPSYTMRYQVRDNTIRVSLSAGAMASDPDFTPISSPN